MRLDEAPGRIKTNARWKQVQVRLANASDVPAIKQIMAETVKIPDADWGDIRPYWIIAYDRERPIAACQICYGKPFCEIVFIEAVSGEPLRTRAVAVKKMIMLACDLAAKSGAQFLGGTVSKRMNTFRDILAGGGSIVVNSGTQMLFKVVR